MIQVQLICISGFRQGLGADNGTHEIWEALRKYQSAQVQVTVCTWNDDWRGRAELIDAFSDPDALILVAAYSWGAGYGLRKLAKHLRKRGRSIDMAVLCDPVYRSRVPLFRWLALVRRWRIRLPENIRRAVWFYQRNRHPMGHLPRPADDPRVIRLQQLDETHNSIDEAEEYYNAVLRYASQFVEQSKQRARRPDR